MGVEVLRLQAIIAVISLALCAGGCGTYTPEMQEFYENRDLQRITENSIINHVKCEIHKGADEALLRWRSAGAKSGLKPDWFKTWNATVTLKLVVDEKGGLSPGVSWIKALSGGNSFTLGAGLDLSSQATRTETISFTYPLTNLLGAKPIVNPCTSGELFIMGDLKIGQFIDKKIFLTTVPETIVGPYSAFNYEVSFIIVTSGSVTPTWNLVDVTANPGAPFAGATRTRTHSVLVTFAAPNDLAADEAARLHNAALIGQAVADAIRR